MDYIINPYTNRPVGMNSVVYSTLKRHRLIEKGKSYILCELDPGVKLSEQLARENSKLEEEFYAKKGVGRFKKYIVRNYRYLRSKLADEQKLKLEPVVASNHKFVDEVAYDSDVPDYQLFQGQLRTTARVDCKQSISDEECVDESEYESEDESEDDAIAMLIGESSSEDESRVDCQQSISDDVMEMLITDESEEEEESEEKDINVKYF